ncbi:hypothetical protein HanIR_Chr16g0791341 [Helianthus annuus]|nr:hypothetical protein HanIR_Chr16g0791341 [Helianthus annuus]
MGLDKHKRTHPPCFDKHTLTTSTPCRNDYTTPEDITRSRHTFRYIRRSRSLPERQARRREPTEESSRRRETRRQLAGTSSFSPEQTESPPPLLISSSLLVVASTRLEPLRLLLRRNRLDSLGIHFLFFCLFVNFLLRYNNFSFK